MFAYIRKHQTLAMIFIVLVCFSFVFLFTETGALTQGGGPENYGSMDGETISRSEYVDAAREAELSNVLRTGSWGGVTEDQIMDRLLLIRRFGDYGIQVDDTAVVQWIRNLGVFAHPDSGEYHPTAYENFLQVLSRNGLSERDFLRFARHEVALRHLIDVAGLPGTLVSAAEAERLFRRQNRKALTTVALFSISNHLSAVEIDPEAVSQFYTNRISMYREPERIQVDYVVFDATNYMAEAEEEVAGITNLDQQLREMYLARGTNSFRNPEGEVMGEEEAMAELKDDLLQGEAFIAARRAAGEFAQELFNLDPVKPENLENLAAAKGIVSHTTEPFTAFEGPGELDVSREFARRATQLTPENPFSTPLPEEDKVFVLALDNRLESEVPPLAEIREKVTEDYRRNEARRVMRESAIAFRSSLTNKMANGQSFEEVANQAGVEIVELPPVSRTTQSLPEADERVNLSMVRSLAFNLEPGEVSTFTPIQEGGMILYLREFQPVTDEEWAEEREEFIANLRRQRQYQAFNEWFMKQEELAQVVSSMGSAPEAEAEESGGTGR